MCTVVHDCIHIFGWVQASKLEGALSVLARELGNHFKQCHQMIMISVIRWSSDADVDQPARLLLTCEIFGTRCIVFIFRAKTPFK